jgi:hypothetical protein
VINVSISCYNLHWNIFNLDCLLFSQKRMYNTSCYYLYTTVLRFTTLVLHHNDSMVMTLYNVLPYKWCNIYKNILWFHFSWFVLCFVFMYHYSYYNIVHIQELFISNINPYHKYCPLMSHDSCWKIIHIINYFILDYNSHQCVIYI